MDFENVEYWVLKSMEEARVSLLNGEVPVGCLFLIQKETLDRLTNEKAGLSKQSETEKVETGLQENAPDNIKNEILIDSNSEASENVSGRSKVEFETQDSNSEASENVSGRSKVEFETQSSVDPSGGYVVIARGKNEVNATKNATRHAELVCIDHIVEVYTDYSSVFENSTVVVNVEPCIMCMAALLELNVRTIVFTCVNDRFGFNILGDETSTNHVEIVEINRAMADKVREEMVLDSTILENEECVETIKQGGRNVESKSDKDKVVAEDMDTDQKCLSKIEVLNVFETIRGVTDVGKTPGNVQYKLLYKDKTLFVKRNDKILSTISCLLGDDGMKMCQVFHFRKYESETMSILKQFYKGVNPNAPKNKVKIKN